MRILTQDADLQCDHAGRVGLGARQGWVTIAGRRVVVATDPEGCSIGGCPNTNPFLGLAPCTTTLAVTTGYSAFVRIDGHRVGLDTVEGLTNGTPQGGVRYRVHAPGQTLVRSDA